MHFSDHVEVNTFLQNLDYPYRLPVLQTRRMLFQADSDIHETVVRGNIIFSIKTEEFCVIKVVKNSVRLIFLNGALMQDNARILMSFGLKSRCVELYEAKIELFNALPKYIQEAIRLVKDSTQV
jgi:hypothetical protein